MMRYRAKQDPDTYPNWMKKQDSPAKLAKQRDGNTCIECGVEDRSLATGPNGQYMLYLHASHLHWLDPDPVEPIDGQRLRARCPSCHRLYDLKWARREEEYYSLRGQHRCLLNTRYFQSRFFEVR